MTSEDSRAGGADAATSRRCLVTGATGYVGGRLVPALLERGFQVRAMTRSAERLRAHPWVEQVEIAAADATEEQPLQHALDGVDVAYYLIHAMGQEQSFEERDRANAGRFARAAELAGVNRIVYLGGMTPAAGELSQHLRSRDEVGRIFLDGAVPAAVLRAAVIIGSGSASFEMLRYLTERLPAMVTPTWVRTRIQPVAIRDVLHYLVACAELPGDVNRTFDIGGPDVLTYEQMMQRYARVAGLPRRVIVPVPVLTPRLSSHWVQLITPVPNRIARPLVESLGHEVVAGEEDIGEYAPGPASGRLGFEGAVEMALRRVRQADVATRWSSASTPGAPSDPLPTDPTWAGGSLYVDERTAVVDAGPESLWQVIEGIGGDRGWYSSPLLWRVRGIADRLLGGEGLRRGRRNPDRVYVGESLDWWRVEAREPGSLLRLRAEMRLPGLAWLEFRICSEAGRTRYVQRAYFHPKGLAGQIYWWGVSPFHGLVFGTMRRNIAREAERAEEARPAGAGDG